MIHPTHLRIGNIVNLLESEKEFNIIRFFDDECLSFKEHVSFDYIGYDEIEAIPISAELLLKLGAVKINENSFNLKGLQINCVNGMWLEYVSRVEIQGLHHLQNVFYFRMNEELNIENL